MALKDNIVRGFPDSRITCMKMINMKNLTRISVL